MDRFAVDELDFESVEPCRPSSFDNNSFQFDINIRARQALEYQKLNQNKKKNWIFIKKIKEIKIYQILNENENSSFLRLNFRISCEVKSILDTILNIITPSNTNDYMRIEKRIFPKLLQCSILKNENKNQIFPRHCIKYHASHLIPNRLTGRHGTPTDFLFEEYVELETFQNRPRAFGYMQSIDTAEEELKKIVSIKTKRGVIRKGLFLVTPIDDQCLTHEIVMMYMMEFPKSFGFNIEKIISAYTERLINMREILFNTLFQTIQILPRHKWIDDRSRQYCAVCESPFTLVRSRHHCRACGEVICHYCSRKWSIPIQDAGELQTRLCTPCSLRARSNNIPSAPVTGPMRLSRSNTTIHTNPIPTTPQEDFDYNDVIHSMHDGNRPLYSMPYPNLNCNYDTIPSFTQIRVGTSMSSSSDTIHAVHDAWEKLVCMLQQHKPHFLFVQYSCSHQPNIVGTTLQELAPDIVFCGNSLGVLDQDVVLFQEEAFVRYSNVLSLWGLYDPDGSFGVSGAKLSDPIAAKEITRQVLRDGIRKLQLGPTESPDFVWLMPSEGYEQVVVDAVSVMLDTTLSTVGASSKQSRICGMARECQVFQDDGSFVVAMCCPSVRVTHAYFTCYEANDRTFGVTKADGKRLMVLDTQAPLGLLKEGLDRQRRKLYLDSKPKVFPAFGRMDPKEKSMQIIEPIAVHSDLTMTLSTPVQRGDQVCLMSMDRKAIPNIIASRIAHGCNEMEIVGCFVSCSASIVQHLGDDFDLLRTSIQNGLGNDPNIAITGSLSMCQLGIPYGAHHGSHSNGMVAALIITNRKKSGWRPRMNHRKSF